MQSSKYHSLSLSHKNIFVILGVARSGTSAIARGLKTLGIDLGDKMNLNGNKWNAKGFWEDTDIVYNINGQIFKTLNFPSYGIQVLEQNLQTSEQLSHIKHSAIQLLSQRFMMTDYWGFKDPSTAKLLAFWQSIFNELNIQDNYVIALRNPLASAQSYKKLTGTEIEIGLLLWLMHLLPAVNDTHNKNRVMVSYDLLMQNPIKQLNRIHRALHLILPINTAEMDAYTHHFLDKKLHRHEYTLEDLKTHPATKVAPLCLQTYELLMKVANDEISFDGAEFQTSWRTIQDELQKIYPVYCYVDTLLKNNNQLKKSLKLIHKSILWKMLYPFRMIDHKLRLRRHQVRAEKRILKAYS